MNIKRKKNKNKKTDKKSTKTTKQRLPCSIVFSETHAIA